MGSTIVSEAAMLGLTWMKTFNTRKVLQQVSLSEILRRDGDLLQPFEFIDFRLIFVLNRNYVFCVWKPTSDTS